MSNKAVKKNSATSSVSFLPTAQLQVFFGTSYFGFLVALFTDLESDVYFQDDRTVVSTPFQVSFCLKTHRYVLKTL